MRKCGKAWEKISGGGETNYFFDHQREERDKETGKVVRSPVKRFHVAGFLLKIAICPNLLIFTSDVVVHNWFPLKNSPSWWLS